MSLSESAQEEDFSAQVKQLSLEFEELPKEEIEKSVVKLADAYKAARITTFVPLFVERFAREELRRTARARQAS